jgi:flap endonuclease-1
VNENGFNIDRVTKAIEKIKTAKNKSSQGRLESFFKPVANSSVPAKRKVCPLQFYIWLNQLVLKLLSFHMYMNVYVT